MQGEPQSADLLACDVADQSTLPSFHSLSFEQRRKVKVSPATSSSARKRKLSSHYYAVRSPRSVR